MNLLEALTADDAPQPVLAVAEDEYRRRLDAVRARMAADGIEVLLVTDAANLCYLTGYETVLSACYAVLAVPLGGDVVFHLPESDVACVTYTGWVRNVVFAASRLPDPADELAEVLRERGHAGKVVGVEMAESSAYGRGAMDVHTYLRLREILPGAEFRDATNLVQEVRLRKSPAELDYMRQAGELTMIGQRASMELLAPGITDSEAAAAAYSAMVASGSEQMAITPTLLGGPRNAWGPPHHTFGRVRLESGDPAYLEYSGCRRRYHAPAMRSVFLGEPSRDARTLAEACLATVESLLEAIRPGRTGHEVAQDAKRHIAALDADTYFHGAYGYAVGLGFPPTWVEAPVYLAEGSERTLEPHMTFHLPIWLWKPGNVAMGFSETVLVTDAGCQLVTPGTARELVIR